MVVQSVALFFRSGASDKEYHASIERSEGGYVVNYSYGRRGTALNGGTKTPEPVFLGEAERIFRKLVSSKKTKGYIEGEMEGREVAQPVAAGNDAGMNKPQLLNPIDDEELKRLLWDDRYGMQEKKNGHRRMVKKDGGNIIGVNRRGLIVGLPEEVIKSLMKIPDCHLDGELVGTMYHVFDILEDDRVECYHEKYSERYEILTERQYRLSFGPNVKVVPLIQGGVMKTQLLNDLKRGGKEGVCFKNLNAMYTAGRPNSGGDQVKYKFYETCTVEVTKRNKGKRSVAIECEGTGVGNVTIPANHTIPKKAELVEIRYLYFNAGGALYEPVYLGVRDDLEAADTVASLKVGVK